uniref:Peptide-methionine (R)-S-oxide reductase n=1 Tax=Panagrellus redivivus TaxID=6233 RepID=A0A7E4V194_PANRE
MNHKSLLVHRLFRTAVTSLRPISSPPASSTLLARRFLQISPVLRSFWSENMSEKDFEGKSVRELLQKPDAKSLTEEDYKKKLTDLEYQVTREASTEAPGTGIYNNHYKPGAYKCKCCGIDLFVSDAKFRTTCGWPAFSESVGKDKNIVRITDTSYGMERVEIRCKQCNAHLGHVFDGEPTPTGERYCVNSCSISFEPAAKQ